MKTKIILSVPGYSDTVFDYYEDLNFIWQVLDNFRGASLRIVYDEDKKQVDEAVSTEEEKYTILEYKVPKSVTFTQRFQDRVTKEITSVLDAVYPDCFSISEVKYEDIEDDMDNMLMKIRVDANNDNTAMNALKFLDNNVEYIIGDLVNYYID